jgi:capping protein beta
VRRCKQTGRDYLLCDYNRDGDSYRSPWSNQFDPPLDEAGVGGVGAGGSNEGAGEGAVPGERVRKMEIKAFDVYRDLYYEGGVSSVYLWNLDDGFAGVVLLKKGELAHTYTHARTHTHIGTEDNTRATADNESTASPQTDSASSGVWDSIHVFEASERGRTSNYRLTSTVILSLATKGASLGEVDLSGNMTRQVEQDLPVENDESHIANIGRLVEDMELKMRNLLQEVYFGKAKDVVGDLRSVGSLSEGQRDRETQRELIGSMRR